MLPTTSNSRTQTNQALSNPLSSNNEDKANQGISFVIDPKYLSVIK
jgi:hypothetical protein